MPPKRQITDSMFAIGERDKLESLFVEGYDRDDALRALLRHGWDYSAAKLDLQRGVRLVVVTQEAATDLAPRGRRCRLLCGRTVLPQHTTCCTRCEGPGATHVHTRTCAERELEEMRRSARLRAAWASGSAAAGSSRPAAATAEPEGEESPVQETPTEEEEAATPATASGARRR